MPSRLGMGWKDMEDKGYLQTYPGLVHHLPTDAVAEKLGSVIGPNEELGLDPGAVKFDSHMHLMYNCHFVANGKHVRFYYCNV
jgi:hypothetical protein